jgi:hypothetical protein
MKANVRKYMSVLIVKGIYRRHIFAKKTCFEIYFYYTPIKKRIMDYRCDEVPTGKLGIGQIIGHDIEEMEKFCIEKGYTFLHIER